MSLPRTPEDMQRAMVENEGGKVDLRGIREASGRAAKRRRSTLAKETAGQAIREAFLDGIRAERMRVSPRCENCGVEGWEAKLELHHLTKRSQGKRYDGETPGVDAPTNLQLLCRSCHQLRESNPRFGERV